jgi:peptide/nickel transport system substrate-binding protein
MPFVADADVLTILIEKRIPSLDPRVSSDSAAERFRQLVFNALTRKNERFEPIPDLATSITLSDDKRVHTFKLRDGVKFHDGRTLTSRDVKYTFDTLMEKGFPSQKKAEVAQVIASVETPDTQTVVITCGAPCPSLPNLIVPIGIIPEGSGAQQATKPVGTGPFAFEYYTDDQEVGLVAFADYFEGKPSISKLHIRISPDSSTRESELRKGSVDVAINADLDPVSVESLKQASGLKVIVGDGTNLTHMESISWIRCSRIGACDKPLPTPSTARRLSGISCAGRLAPRGASFRSASGHMKPAVLTMPSTRGVQQSCSMKRVENQSMALRE